MNYDLHSPCINCPFRKEGGIRLRAGRVRELIRNTQNPGAEFACHKTLEDGKIVATSQHCAGALIFAQKQGTSTQMMRICERLRLFDPSKLKSLDAVFDSAAEFRATAIDRKRDA